MDGLSETPNSHIQQSPSTPPSPLPYLPPQVINYTTFPVRKMSSSWRKTAFIILVAIVLALNFTQLAGLPTSYDSGRYLAETDNVSEPFKQSDDTVRIDPLENFKKYRGGYDITNKNYWSSTAFTGIYGYAIAVVWLLCGIGYGGYLLVTRTCCRNNRKLKKRSPCHKQCYLQPLLVATFFTILAITATGLVLGGNAKFHSRAKTVIDIIIDTADDASDTIHEATGAMKNMSTNLGEANGSTDATNFLTSTSQRLDSQASDIERQARKNRRAIDKGLKIVYIVTTLTISLNLVAVIALLVFGVLKFQRTLSILIALCWILTILYWVFFGVYFFLGNFVGDTCTALESFQQDPYNNSLSSILPCDDLLSARSVLTDVSAGVYNLVNEVNNNITSSYANIVQICNPFSPPPDYEFQPWNCPASSIKIGDIPRILRMLTCPGSEGDTCNGGILIPANDFNTVEAYSTSIQQLLDVYPGMEHLVECQMVKDAFSEILHDHCKPLKRYVRMTWAALVFLSVVMMALVLIWTTESHHEQEHHSLGGSVKPHSTAADMPESETTKATNNDQIPV
ncbi:uncharacterized protein LOC111371543 isoform X1 [Olea europaea subsp. europaea]|uniref:Uncharacterized protein LOC111371543 isoform X1 n=2 Tax=Olea europaea subsp. europaea TaxID=158383 RepID=A0A8S0R1V9_OLEEU|nr:uncharacterized protein LOC111371543 isoform X1 [Olea europaea subsp. europaea]